MKMKIWLTAIAVMMSVHTSAMAEEIWQEEDIITDVVRISYMSDAYTYETSDPTVATVDKNGMVTFHKEGYVVITRRQGDLTVHAPFRVCFGSVDTAAYEAEVVRLVNEERAKCGIAPLLHDTAYQVCADIRAEECETYYSHTRPDGRNWSTVLNEYGLSNIYMAENLALGSTTPAAVVELWMGSDGHRESMLNPVYNHLAVSCRQSADGTFYWVQLFTRR